MSLRVAVWNVKRRRRGVAWMIRHHHPHVFGIVEAFTLVPWLRRRIRYKWIGARGRKQRGPGWRDCGILIRRGLTVVDWGQHRISDGVPGHRGVAHTRRLWWVTFHYPGLGLVTFAVTHTTPLRKGIPEVNEAHEDGAANIVAWVQTVLDHPDTYGHLVFTGDLNRKRGQGVWADLDQLLHVDGDHIDVIAWSDSLQRATRVQQEGGRQVTRPAWDVVDRRHGRTDHEGLVGAWQARR